MSAALATHVHDVSACGQHLRIECSPFSICICLVMVGLLARARHVNAYGEQSGDISLGNKRGAISPEQWRYENILPPCLV